MNPEGLSFDTGPGRQVGHGFKGGNEFGPAIGVAGVIHGIDTDKDILRLQHFRPAQSDGQEHRVACRHIGNGDALRRLLRHVDVFVSQGRTAELGEVNADDTVIADAHGLRYSPRGLEFDAMPLAVIEAEGMAGIALLAGDTLLFKGLYAMHEAVESLPEGKKQAVLKLTKQAFFGISSAEAQEAGFRGNPDLSAQEFLENIKGKAAVAEATAKIGATLGDANANEIERLGNYGKTLGILMTIRDQFIDLFEPDEIKERAERECLPLPILFVFRDEKDRKKIERLLKKGDKITKEDTDKIVDIVMTTKETRKLRRQMQRMIKNGKAQLASAKHDPRSLKFILESIMEDLE